jgi:molybdopterin converting factor small subunit
MVVKVWIPPQLRSVTDGNSSVPAKGDTVHEVLLDLKRQFPAFTERVLDENGKVRPYLNIYLNDEDIRFLQGASTPVKDGDEFSIILEIGGGRATP